MNEKRDGAVRDGVGRDGAERDGVGRDGFTVDIRGSSTTLDTVLFVLLVGAAVGTLATADTGGSGDRTTVATETADVLSTSTTHVTYTQSYTVLHERLLGTADAQRVRIRRTAGGTHAELLAAAAAASPTVAGTTLVTGDDALRREVRAVTERVLPSRGANVQVRAVWRPYEGSPPGGAFAVGDSPPGDADLTVATMSVPSGFPNVTGAAAAAARTDGYDGVAAAVASGLVEGLFPPDQVRAALYSEGPALGAVAARYQRAADRLGVETAPLLERRDVQAANERLADALADRLRPELARAFESPRAAARALRVDSVRIVVRTWSS